MYIVDRAIPFNSTVVVVGANGYMGTETCDKLLEAGYRVRGTVRNVEKQRGWMSKLFDEKWPGKFELVQVLDFEVKGAFDEAFKGTRKFRHIILNKGLTCVLTSLRSLRSHLSFYANDLRLRSCQSG